LIEFSVATRERIGRALAQGRHLILRIPRGGVSLESVREQLAGTAAAALLVSGGDTASLVCHAAGVKSIELYDEVVCGIPRGILRGGDLDGMAVVTKSGGFGDENALIDVADYFA
jgi:uncharacterized protein YgbK (DUF1537 family)